ncbi:RHS repeat-associated core domain-containing protein [Actinomadura sp. NTSP31]|uniref:RHS repeat-associated core domain-containing protein n=1 Tax=Actinomadura sp. NTSP31 TaxID=1735447 RepID=UPI0035BEF220
MAGDYTFSRSYTDTTGLPSYALYPGKGTLSDEEVDYGYTGPLDLPASIGGDNAYALEATYTAYGQVAQTKVGSTRTNAFITNAYDDHTQALTDTQFTNPAATSVPIDQTSYKYDLAGNPTSQTTIRQGTQAETQCFGYDALDRLSQAWTATDACKTDPSSNNGATVGSGIQGGIYWSTWTFDALGQRQTETRHGTGGAGDTATTYTYNGAGNPQPHALTATSTTTAAAPGATPTTTRTQAFTYDKTGDTLERTTTSDPGQADEKKNQDTLGWDDTGQLTSVTNGSGGPSYIYDADGQLLLQKDSDTKTTTLYLPAEQLTLNTTTGAIGGTRYYALPGGAQAVRTADATGTKYFFQTADQHGTADLTIDPAFSTATWRQQTPYGGPRGTKPANWPDNHEFLGQPQDDTTGLTNIGARWYDPDLGRFASLDPIFQATDTQQQNGYTYAADNPIAKSDPSGLCAPDIGCPTNPDQRRGTGRHSDGAAGGCAYWTIAGCGTGNGGSSGRGNYGNGGTGSGGGGSSGGGGAGSGGGGSSGGGGAASHPRPSCSVMCQLRNVGNGVVDGVGQVGADLGKEIGHFFTNLAGSLVGLGCIGMPTVQGACLGNTEANENAQNKKIDEHLNVHVNLGGDTKSPTYKITKTVTEIVAPALIPGGEEESAAVGAGIVRRTVSRIARRFGKSDSFSGATPVRLADGATKPISQIKVGDKIAAAVPIGLAGSPAPDQAHRVTAIHITHTDRDYTDVTIPTRAGPQAIHGTAHHLYWDVTNSAWTPADHLRVGDQLQTANGHTSRSPACTPSPQRSRPTTSPSTASTPTM